MDFKERLILLSLADEFCNSNYQQHNFSQGQFTNTKCYKSQLKKKSCKYDKFRSQSNIYNSIVIKNIYYASHSFDYVFQLVSYRCHSHVII